MNNPTTRIAVGDRVKLIERGRKRIWIAEFHKDGRHCRLSMKTANLKVARERAMKLAVSLNEGTFRAPPPVIAVDIACADHIEYHRTKGNSDGTIEKYEGIFELWKKFLERQGVRYLHQFTPTHFDRYRAERILTRSATTVYDDSVLITQLFAWAKTRKLLMENLLADVRFDRPELKVKFCPTLSQVNAILAAAGEPFRTYWATLAFSGLRSGELKRLRIVDLDLAENWIHVRSRTGGRTKNGKSRHVPIHPRLRAILTAIPATSRDFQFTNSGDIADPRPVDLRRLNDHLQALLPKLSIPAGRPEGMVTHSFRHFFETEAVNAGVPQPVIDRWMGHALDPTEMKNVYYGFNARVSQEKIKLIGFAEADEASQTTAVKRA